MISKGLKVTPCCVVHGCGALSAYHPVLKAWAIGYSKTSEPMTAALGIGFCELHRDAFKLDDFPDVGRLMSAAASVSGKAQPNLNGIEFEMLPLGPEVAE